MAPLVDYDSSSSSDSENVESAKRLKTDHSSSKRDDIAPKPKTLPPLPSAFHDLYASTVRVSTTDDPTLHQGRKRVNPHKVGNWPSHLYIEWHPSVQEQSLLSALLDRVQTAIQDGQPHHVTTPAPKISSFLTSDLGAPQPLHISLSRPVVLTTLQKDGFLEDITKAIRHGTGDALARRPSSSRDDRHGGAKGTSSRNDDSDATGTSTLVRPFELAPSTLEWHRTPESERSFLVLRVRSSTGRGNEKVSPPVPKPSEQPAAAETAPTTTKRRRTRRDTAIEQEKEEAAVSNTKDTTTTTTSIPTTSTNPQLTSLLRTCNTLVTSYDQPALYTSSSTASSSPQDAFHISLAWSFAEPEPWIREATESAFTSSSFSPSTASSLSTTSTLNRIIQDSIRVPVDGIKAKIGNVVTHVGLPRLYLDEERDAPAVAAATGEGGGGGGTVTNISRKRGAGLKELF